MIAEKCSGTSVDYFRLALWRDELRAARMKAVKYISAIVIANVILAGYLAFFSVNGYGPACMAIAIAYLVVVFSMSLIRVMSFIEKDIFSCLLIQKKTSNN